MRRFSKLLILLLANASLLTPSFAQLFTAGQVGDSYDPNNFAAQFQDNAGITPVTAAGQQVGCVLDLSRGMALLSHAPASDNMNGGGDWAASAGGWTGTGPNSCACDGTNVGTSAWTSAAGLPLVVGQTLRMRFTVAAASGTFTIVGAGVSVTVPAGAANYTLYVGGGASCGFSAVAGRVLNITGISFDYLDGTVLRQTTTGARPQLTALGNGFYAWQFDGVDDNLASISGNFTIGVNSKKCTLWIGARRTQDATDSTLVQLGNSFVGNGCAGIRAPDGAAANFGFLLRGSTVTAERTAATGAAPVSAVLSCNYDTGGVTTGGQVMPRINGAPAVLVDVAGPTTDTGAGVSASNILRLGSSNSTSFFAGLVAGFVVRTDNASLGDLLIGERVLSRYMSIPLAS